MIIPTDKETKHNEGIDMSVGLHEDTDHELQRLNTT